MLIFSREATTTDVLREMGGWKLAQDPRLYLHLRSFGLDQPTAEDMAALISEMWEKHGERFDAARFEERLSVLTNDNLADDENPLWGIAYRLLRNCNSKSSSLKTKQSMILFPRFRGPKVSECTPPVVVVAVCLRGPI